MLKSLGVELIEAKKIADKLGYLPLALNQAGGYISTMQIPLSDYLTYYARSFKEVTAAPVSLESYRNDTLYTTWKISFDSLPSTARRLLVLCSFLGDQHIVEELIDRGVKVLVWLKEGIIWPTFLPFNGYGC